MKSLLAYWQRCAPREQRMLRLMFLVVIGGGLIQLLTTALSQREQLAKQSRTLIQEHATLKMLAAAKQNTVAPTANTATPLQGAPLLERLRGLGAGTELQLSITGPDRISGQGTIAFDNWIQWLALVQKEQRLYPLQIEIQRSNDAGRVKVNFELARPA